MSLVVLAVVFALELIGSNGVNVVSTERSVARDEEVTEAIQISFSNGSVVAEMQHTTCSIKTEEIVAKAQSTASRILTGVCTSEEMTKAFKSLEKKVFERLDEIQQNLIAIIQSKMQPVAPRKIYKNTKPSPFKTIDYSFDDELFKNYT